MDTSDAINCTEDDDRIMHFNTYIEKDKSQRIKKAAQQNLYEEKNADNGLKFSVLLHIFVIVSTVAIIILDLKLLTAYNKENKFSRINFGLIKFYIRSNNETTNYYYDCIQPNEKFYESSKNSICTIRKDCTKENKEITFDTSELELTCNNFKDFMILGIVVKFYN